MIRHHGAADAEQQDDDGEAERGFSHRDADREDGEHHPCRLPAVAREGDEVDVDRVHHQLDAEQDANRVAARRHAEQADAEHDRRQDEIRLQAH